MGSPEFSALFAKDESIKHKSLLIDPIVALCSDRLSQASQANLKESRGFISQGYSVLLILNHLSHLDLPLAQKAVRTLQKQSNKNLPQYWFGTTRLDPAYFDNYQDIPEVASYIPTHMSHTSLPEYSLMKQYLRNHNIQILPVMQPKDVKSRTIPRRVKQIMIEKSEYIFEASLNQLKTQQIIVGLFPEGERSQTGELGVPTQTTNAYLHKLESTIVLPIAIKGTNLVYPKDGSALNLRARMQIIVLPPWLPEDLNKQEKPAHTIFSSLADALQK